MSERPTAEAAGKIDVGGDLTVNRLGFGAMRITGQGVWGPPPDRERAKAALRRAVELGVNFIDTADSYGPDVCEGSLRRLRVDRIDLYQLHRPDPKVPLAESIGALKELKDAGKIGHIGVSNFGEQQLREAEAITPVVSVQNRYNVTDRSSETMVDLCEQESRVFLPWAPISESDNVPLRTAAERHGVSTRQIAIAWMLARSPQILPIPGSGSAEHVEENIAAARIELDAQEQNAITDVVG